MTGDLTKGFDDSQRRLVEGLIGMGFVVKPIGKGSGVSALAPDGHTRITVSQKDHGPTYKQTLSAVNRWIDSLTPAQVLALPMPEWVVSRARRVDAARAIVEEQVVPVALRGVTDPSYLDTYGEEMMPASTDAISLAVIAAGDRARSGPPFVEAEAPWLAHKNPGDPRTGRLGKRYESSAVTERIWSDGHTDYRCAEPDCDRGPDSGPYVADNPLSVARHYAGHTKTRRRAERDVPSHRGKREIIDPLYDQPLTLRQYRPSQRLIDLLAEYLIAHGDLGGAQETAEAALIWAHERPDLPMAPEQTVVAPLTPDEQVERIAAIIGQPYAGQVKALTEQVDALTKDLAEVVGKYESLREDVRVWRSLAPGEED